MKRLISVLKSIRLGQILTVFLVGAVLLISTACSGANTPSAQGYDQTMKGLPGQTEPEVSKSARIKPEPKTGMNAYSDTDPRLKTTEAEGQAQNLVKSADQNITEKRATNSDQYVQNYREGAPLGERTRRFAEDAGASVRNATEDTQRASTNALNRTQNAVGSTSDRAQTKAEEASEDTRQASENILNKVTKSVKRAAEDTSDFVQGKTEEASKGTQRALEDTSDAMSGNRT